MTTLEWLRLRLTRLSVSLFKFPLLPQFLFGVKCQPILEGEHFFDIPTFVLCQVLKKELKKTDLFWDMGAGSFAILGIAVKKSIQCPVIFSEVNPTIAIRAQSNLQLNGIHQSVLNHDLFENFQSELPAIRIVIGFNPPYVPQNHAQSIKLDFQYRSQWDGGPDGTAIIEKFLRGFSELKVSGAAYLGVNYWHITTETMLSLIKKYPIQIIRIMKGRFLPTCVYVIQNSVNAKN